MRPRIFSGHSGDCRVPETGFDTAQVHNIYRGVKAYVLATEALAGNQRGQRKSLPLRPVECAEYSNRFPCIAGDSLQTGILGKPVPLYIVMPRGIPQNG